MATATPVDQHSGYDKETSPNDYWKTLPVGSAYKCHRLHDDYKHAAGGHLHERQNFAEFLIRIGGNGEPVITVIL